MFWTFFSPPRRMPSDLRDELLALCHSEQIRLLSLPDGSGRDIAFDCGCAADGTRSRPFP